jgi:hypothetical protein
LHRSAVAAKARCAGCGAVAQMGERCNRTAEVRGSIPLSSTSFRFCFALSNRRDVVQLAMPARLIVLAGLAVITTCCVAPRQPLPPATPAPPLALPPPAVPLAQPAADWRDAPLTPGSWRFDANGGQSQASYAGISFACRADRRVQLSGPGISGEVTLTSSYGVTSRSAGAEGMLFSANDPLLDQLAFSRGRFMLASPSLRAILPAWPEIGRVIEDCRG